MSEVNIPFPINELATALAEKLAPFFLMTLNPSKLRQQKIILPENKLH